MDVHRDTDRSFASTATERVFWQGRHSLWHASQHHSGAGRNCKRLAPRLQADHLKFLLLNPVPAAYLRAFIAPHQEGTKTVWCRSLSIDPAQKWRPAENEQALRRAAKLLAVPWHRSGGLLQPRSVVPGWGPRQMLRPDPCPPFPCFGRRWRTSADGPPEKKKGN